MNSELFNYYFNRPDGFSGVDPSKIEAANLVLWIDASDKSTITLTSNRVVDWADKSSNGYNFSQDGAASQPIYNSVPMNNRPTVTFDGNTDYMVTDETGIIDPGSSDFTCYMVFRTFISQFETPLAQQDGTGTGRSWIRTNHLTGNLETFLGGVQQPIASYTQDRDIIVILEHNNTGNNLKVFYDGGTAVYDDTKAIEAATGALVLGAVKQTTGQFLQGELAEMFIYDKILSLVNFNALGNYVGNKWGITWTDRTV